VYGTYSMAGAAVYTVPAEAVQQFYTDPFY